MKSRVALGILLVIGFLTVSCSEKTDDNVGSTPLENSVSSGKMATTTNTTTSPKATAQCESTADQGTSSPISTTEPVTQEPIGIASLDLKDFAVTDGKTTILLDTPFKDFQTSEAETPLDNNYVGETTSGDSVYKNYMHEYADFDLYTSNADYDTKNRSFDEYFITQISLKTAAFKTARGISVGVNLDDIVRLYGSGNKVESEGSTSVVYRLNDMQLSFDMDDAQRVQSITLNSGGSASGSDEDQATATDPAM
ncbi:hypothetical protein [Gorillibacterium massiliense]|uniref:hypothetical protein n=1 Tax=Gorillibacterium massiliense TaxID=1280390 RepID=UPI0004B497B5|nr:hypothetical protein [Gorillibacterium massiliense]